MVLLTLSNPAIFHPSYPQFVVEGGLWVILYN